jgi:hypothetical protein
MPIALDSPLDRLAGFLTSNPPHLTEILGAVCEVYRTDPDRIDITTHTRRVFCFVASSCRYPRPEIARHAKILPIQVYADNQKIRPYLRTDVTQRRCLDLIAVRLAERVLVRRADEKAHA